MINQTPTGKFSMKSYTQDDLTERFTMTRRNFQEILKEFKRFKNTEMKKDSEGTVTLYFKGRKILVAIRGIGGERSIRAVKGALGRTYNPSF